MYAYDGTAWRRPKYWYTYDGSAWRRAKVVYSYSSGWNKVFPPAISTFTFQCDMPSSTAGFDTAYTEIVLSGFTLGGAVNASGKVTYTNIGLPTASTLGTLGTYLSNPNGSNPYYSPAIVGMDINPARESLAWDWAAADLSFTVDLKYYAVPVGVTVTFRVAGTTFNIVSVGGGAVVTTSKTVTVGAFGTVTVT